MFFICPCAPVGVSGISGYFFVKGAVLATDDTDEHGWGQGEESKKGERGDRKKGEKQRWSYLI